MDSLDLENGDCYDDDGFEENSVTKSQQQIGNVDDNVERDEQVHPLGASVKLSAVAKTTAATSDVSASMNSDEEEEEDAGGYSDDEFDSPKRSPRTSSVHPSAMHLSSVAAKHPNVPAAQLQRSHVDEAYDEQDDTDIPSAAPAVDKCNVESEPVDLVGIHAHRNDDATVDALSLPPAPVRVSPTQQLELARQLQMLQLSKARASIAAKRVTQYRELQAQRDAQAQTTAAASKKAREQFRASNRASYDAMGVRGLTGEQRYAELLDEATQRKRYERACAALAKQQRWYNQRQIAAVVTGSTLSRHAASHIAQLHRCAQEARRQHHDATTGRAQRIESRQAALHTRATALVTACTGVAYVRGSYLLTAERRAGRSSRTHIGA